MVAGATGGTGAAIVEALVQAGARQVIAFVRDESKARSKLPKDVKIVQGDLYQYSTIPAAVRGCDAVVCAAGPKGILLDPLAPYKTDLVGITNLVNICTGCGVKKLVLVSSIGVDITNVFASLAFWGLLFMKKRGEEVVQRSGLDYTILRPGGLKDGKIEDGDNVVMGGPDTFGFPPGKSSGSILRSQVIICGKCKLLLLVQLCVLFPCLRSQIIDLQSI